MCEEFTLVKSAVKIETLPFRDSFGLHMQVRSLPCSPASASRGIEMDGTVWALDNVFMALMG